MKLLFLPLGLLLLGAFIIDGTTWDWLGYVLIGAGSFLLVVCVALAAFVAALFFKHGRELTDESVEEYFTNFGRKIARKPE